jgi:hypothetical protein
MLDTPLFRTLRLVVTGMVCALGLQFALAAAPIESRICVGAMQTTACVPPA